MNYVQREQLISENKPFQDYFNVLTSQQLSSIKFVSFSKDQVPTVNLQFEKFLPLSFLQIDLIILTFFKSTSVACVP